MKNLPLKFQKILSVCFLITVLASPLPAVATEEAMQNWYTVEVITFTRSKDSQLQEKWLQEIPADTLQTDSNDTIADNLSVTASEPAAASILSVQPVPEKEWKLLPHAFSLGKSPEIKISSHQSWRQPGFNRDEAPWISLETKTGQMTGKIRISLSRYLHADLDITLENPDWISPDTQSTGISQNLPSRYIHFVASRRMKRDEIHYIDHPLAGALVRIERFEMPSDVNSGEPDSLKATSAIE